VRERPVSIALAYDWSEVFAWMVRELRRRRGDPMSPPPRPKVHVLEADSAGGVHERISDQPAGVWSTWDQDWLPARVTQAKGNRKAGRKSR
jgi:hypothetical protein